MGNEIEERYFGVNDEPILREEMTAHVAANRYDGYGKVTEAYFLGINDEPVDCPEGYHKRVTEYDPSGNAISTSYFEHEGKPVLDSETEVHMIRRRYDTKNQLTEIFYEDSEGKSVLANNGYARQMIDYDVRGNISEIQYFGVNSERVLYKGGTRWLRSYDSVTNEPLETFIYDLEGNLVEE